MDGECFISAQAPRVIISLRFCRPGGGGLLQPSPVLAKPSHSSRVLFAQLASPFLLLAQQPPLKEMYCLEIWFFWEPMFRTGQHGDPPPPLSDTRHGTGPPPSQKVLVSHADPPTLPPASFGGSLFSQNFQKSAVWYQPSLLLRIAPCCSLSPVGCATFSPRQPLSPQHVLQG